MEASSGDAVCLRCRVAGTPDIAVSWFKADGRVRPGAGLALDFVDGVASLKLSKASASDAGDYSCRAENRVGSASSGCRLDVHGLYRRVYTLA